MYYTDKESRDLFMITTQEEFEKKYLEVCELVKQADEQLVRKYLVKSLIDDSQKLLRFRCNVYHQTSKNDLDKNYQIIDQLTFELYNTRYISYNEVNHYFEKLYEFLDENVKDMIERKEYNYAFQLINHIVSKVDEAIMYSDGDECLLIDLIDELWKELIKDANNEDKEEMFYWFADHLEDYEYLEDKIEEIFLNEFYGEIFHDSQLYVIKQQLKKYKEDPNSNYKVEYWSLKCLELLQKYRHSETEINRFKKQYWKYGSIRNYYYELYMENKDYTLVLQVLNDSIAIDYDYPHLITKYQKQKKNIYLLLGDQQAYINQLYQILYNFDTGNFEAYLELKKCYDEKEWKQVREEIFSRIKSHVSMDRFYQEEKLYDRLLEVVLNKDGLDSLSQYQNDLMKFYPNELLDKYEKELDIQACHTSNRDTYRYLVKCLNDMKEIEGGIEKVNDICRRWRERYNNRPAMMDELKAL